jgi:16S rRNA processing protein RimM
MGARAAGAPQAAPAWPDDAVEVGRIVGAWGVRGAFKVQPLSADPQALLAIAQWFLEKPKALAGRAGGRMALEVDGVRRHGAMLVAQSAAVGTRDDAQALAGARVFVPRARFPAAGADEYYWVDLIGCQVVDRSGTEIGRVSSLFETGANDVMRVAGEAGETLIPFVAAHVDEVDLNRRVIRVDWPSDD